MKLTYFGHACFALNFDKKPALVIDPFDGSVNYPPCAIDCDAALLSHEHFDHNYTDSLGGRFATIRAAGEYEVCGARIRAIESYHDEEQGALRGKNLLFRIEKDDLAIAHLGDLGHLPSDEQREFLKNLDLLLIPIGGYYTIDTAQAEEIIRDLKPRHAIGMHYSTKDYPAAMSTEAQFVQDTDAALMPREIEITKETLSSLPKYMVMNYK